MPNSILVVTNQVPVVTTYSGLRSLSTTDDAVFVNNSSYGGLFIKSTGSEENGGTKIASSSMSNVSWTRAQSLENPGHIYSQWWAVGEKDHLGRSYNTTSGYGIIDEADKYTAACYVGGSGSTIFGAPGSYEIGKSIVVGKSQTIDFNGAFIKRATSPMTTLATGYAGGTQIQVSDASSFRVGDQITLVHTASASTGLNDDDTVPIKTITSISGNYITANNVFENPVSSPTGFPAGSRVIRAFDMVNCTDDGHVLFQNAIFDGNRTGNNYNYSWRINRAINISSAIDSWIVQRFRFQNMPSECVMGTIHGAMLQCECEDINGSMVHLSDSNDSTKFGGLTFKDCRGRNTGEQATLNGHAAGVFEWSANVKNVICENCIFDGGQNTQQGCFGNLGSDDETFKISNCKFYNYERIVNISQVTASGIKSDYTLTDSYFSGCGDIEFEGNQIEAAKGPTNIRIENCVFRGNTRFAAEDVANLTIANTRIIYDEGIAFGTALQSDEAAIRIADCQNVRIKGLDLVGPTGNNSSLYYGLLLKANSVAVAKTGVASNSNYVYGQHISVEDVNIRNFVNGLATSNSQNLVWTTQVLDWYFDNINVFMYSDPSVAGAAGGVQLPPGAVAGTINVWSMINGNSSAYPVQLYGIDSTGPRTSCLGAQVGTIRIFGDGTRSLRIGGTTAGRSDYNVHVNHVYRYNNASAINGPTSGRSTVQNDNVWETMFSSGGYIDTIPVVTELGINTGYY